MKDIEKRLKEWKRMLDYLSEKIKEGLHSSPGNIVEASGVG